MPEQEPPPDARAALLTAALDELVEHGVAGVGLRAGARRAGLSHAAPGYFFRDRAGMLTALAVRGFDLLAERLERLPPSEPQVRLTTLGDAYVEFGLTNGPLFDLMYSLDVLRTEDHDLEFARRRALTPLMEATDRDDGVVPVDALMSWALVHGLVALVRQGALPVGDEGVEEVVHGITSRFAARAS